MVPIEKQVMGIFLAQVVRRSLVRSKAHIARKTTKLQIFYRT